MTEFVCTCGQSFRVEAMTIAHQTYCSMIPVEKQEARLGMLKLMTPDPEKVISLTRQQEKREKANL